jgi:hypothetical protein
MTPPIAMALHGGCGTLPRAELTETEWAQSRDALKPEVRANALSDTVGMVRGGVLPTGEIVVAPQADLHARGRLAGRA